MKIKNGRRAMMQDFTERLNAYMISFTGRGIQVCVKDNPTSRINRIKGDLIK
jgi:hypothetical protein